MREEIEERVIDLKDVRQISNIKDFLVRFDLSFDETVEYTVALYQEDRLVATGSLAGKILRNIAILPEFQGTGLTAQVISHLIREQSNRGRFHYFIFTKPDKTKMFEGLGFKEIARAEPYAALLESGMESVESFCRKVAVQADKLPSGKRAALVVNCNPFTLGHRALIENAAAENAAVIVFVVSEDRSLFPFDIRLKLVKEGLADLSNVVIAAGGDYIISQATFPGYFTRGEETVAAQTKLDAMLFATKVAPLLAITSRYVGEEPYCPVTRAYNTALEDILPRYGVSLKILRRIEADGDIISASKVRDMLRLDDWEGIKKAVPETTFAFLRSEEAQPILKKIKQSQSRH